jgi:hypothetical protein
VFGRPTEYRPEFCEKLIEHMRFGNSFETFGAKVFAGKQTLYRWLENNEDFRDAKEIGTRLSEQWWERRGKYGLFHPNFKVAAWRLNMANRFGWAEKQITEHKGGIDLSKKYENKTDEELEEEAKKYGLIPTEK